jgi:hypothetical protein
METAVTEITDAEPNVTLEELAVYDDIAKLAMVLWEKSQKIEGLNTDPKMFSIMLFKRLASNNRGYTLLWNNSFRLEADIVLRSALEASICISANAEMKGEFVSLMKRDAAFTLQGHIKMYREDNEMEMVSDCEELLRLMQKGFPDGTKATKLDWKALAEAGKVPQLYAWHRMLSGLSSHVSGLSVLWGVGGEGLDGLQADLRKLNRKMHLMMMAGATLHGSMHHSIMIQAPEELDRSIALINRMNDLSWSWPGVDEI